jgi:hypothetical protein
MASLEKSRNSLQTGVRVEALFMLRCDRNPVMLTWLHRVNKIAALGCLRLGIVARSLRSMISFGLWHFTRSPWNS